MTKRKQMIVSSISAAVSLAAAQAAFGQYAISGNLAPVQTAGGNSYNGVYQFSAVKGSYLAGYAQTSDANTSGKLVYLSNTAGGTTVLVGLEPSDSSVYGHITATAPAPGLGLNLPASGSGTSLPAGLTDPAILASNGAVLGTAARYNTGNGSSSTGSDVWVYTPGVNTTGTTAGVLTPSLVNPTGATPDGTASYSYTITVGTGMENFESATGYAVVNTSAGSVAVGTANRYVGSTSSTSLGRDVFVSTQAANGSVSTTELGLGLSSTGNDIYQYSYSAPSSGFYFESSAPLNNATLTAAPGLLGATPILSNGIVAGNSNRYDNASNAGSSATSAGVDSWVYVPGTGTLQVGLTGGNYELAPTASTSYTGTNQNFRDSLVTQMNSTGTKYAGVSYTYNGTLTSDGTGPGPNDSGKQAWVYTPTSASSATTSTGFTGGYVQVGLYDQSTSTTVGHAATNRSNGYNTVNTLSNNGIAAGVASRYNYTTSATLGADAWVYVPSGSSAGTTNIQPNFAATSGVTVSYYQPQVPTSGTAPFTVPTVTAATTGIPASSNYIELSSATASPGPGNANMTVTAQNATGWVGGTILRYDLLTGAGVGQDAYVYDPLNKNEYILASPTSSSNSFGSITLSGLSDNGVATGYYQTYSGTTASTLTGRYLYEWSLATGLVTLDDILSSPSSISVTGFTFYPLNNQFSPGQSGWSNLLAGGTTGSLGDVPLVDSSGDVFGYGYTGSGTSGAPNGVFEISAAVPEPTSLALVGIGSLALLGRRRRA